MAAAVHSFAVERPTLDLDLDLPPRRRWAALDDELAQQGRAVLQAVMKEIPQQLRPLADLVRLRTRGRFQADFRAVAARLDASWRDVVLAAVSYDLTIAAFGCSTLALATADGPVLARNLDWWPEALLARTSLRVVGRSGGRARIITAGWPGSIGVVTGLAPGRFAVAINAVSAPDERARATGYPVLLFLARVLEDAPDFDAALRLMTQTRLAASCLLTLVGVENHQRVVVERTSTRHALRRPPSRGAPLYTTNDYRALYADAGSLGQGLHETSCSRFHALTKLLAPLDPARPVADEWLLRTLAHRDVIQEITAQHVIARPAAGDSFGVWVPRRLLSLRAL